MVQPIDNVQQAEVALATEHYIARAEALFARHFDRVPVLFDLKGRAAGMFKVIGKRRVIRFNPWIFAKYYEENLRDTVPHEVAHFIVHEMYPRRGVKPHGRQWQELMARFGADAGVTFDLDLDGVPQRSQRTHAYHCGCRRHDVSTTRHNRVQRRRMRYHCCRCDGLLVYTPQLAFDHPAPQLPGLCDD
ncbi:MAG: SprT-like domain-containing protein [Halioglobus sp.]